MIVVECKTCNRAAQFIETIYRACGVARRVFEPLNNSSNWSTDDADADYDNTLPMGVIASDTQVYDNQCLHFKNYSLSGPLHFLIIHYILPILTCTKCKKIDCAKSENKLFDLTQNVKKIKIWT